jgi:hypothetical protein
LAAVETHALPPVTGTDADFSILPSLPDAHLPSVVLDNAIVFAPGKGSPQEALQLIRAKELAQASLAALAARKAQESLERLAREASDQGVPSRRMRLLVVLRISHRRTRTQPGKSRRTRI